MPTSAPGSSQAGFPRRHASGFTVIELIVVVAIVALAAALISVTIRDPAEARLDDESARLATLLEMARAESRASGLDVRWVPRPDASGDAPAAAFRFVGLPPTLSLPTRWLDPDTGAEVVGATTVVLGPDAILPPQRIVLRLGDSRRVVASDGLASFAVLEGDALASLAGATP